MEDVDEDSGFGAPVVGRCLTMCSEKQALERQEQKDFSVYEQEPSTIGTRERRIRLEWAVKKYARPAAGTAPDPEDIRPPAVLKRTMSYLIDVIVDREDQPYTEVYSFLRDRTRSIRQDMIFQHAVTLDSIELTEMIARFHIFSEHRLCEEGPSEFDAKLNREQLHKCLITLRELYDDRFDARCHEGREKLCARRPSITGSAVGSQGAERVLHQELRSLFFARSPVAVPGGLPHAALFCSDPCTCPRCFVSGSAAADKSSPDVCSRSVCAPGRRDG